MNYGVITVCLNSSATIGRTIESILQQSELPEKYIFVDGGSADRTVDVIKETVGSAKVSKNAFKFEIIDQRPKRGIAAAWNMGLNRLDTDLVFILNSDDWYEKDTVRKILSLFDRNREIDVIFGSARYFNSVDHRPVSVCHPRPFLWLPFLMSVVHPACFVRKDVYRKIGQFDERYKVAADYDFIYRCLRSAIRFRRVDDILTNMDLGGFASSNKEISRTELLEIGLKYGRIKVFPRMAYAMRRFLGR